MFDFGLSPINGRLLCLMCPCIVLSLPVSSIICSPCADNRICTSQPKAVNQKFGNLFTLCYAWHSSAGFLQLHISADFTTFESSHKFYSKKISASLEWIFNGVTNLTICSHAYAMIRSGPTQNQAKKNISRQDFPLLFLSHLGIAITGCQSWRSSLEPFRYVNIWASGHHHRLLQMSCCTQWSI